MSIREMKKKLKNELPIGTFVNNDVYIYLQEAVDKYLTDLSKVIALTFADSDSRILKENHVTEALTLIGMTRLTRNNYNLHKSRLEWRK